MAESEALAAERADLDVEEGRAGIELTRGATSGEEFDADLSDAEDTQAEADAQEHALMKAPPLTSVLALPCFDTAGNNYVVLQTSDGRPRITFGPHWPGLLCTFGLLSFATSFFVNKWLPLFPLACTVIAYILFCASLLFLTLTGCTDPGIIRASPVLQDEPTEAQPYCDICEIYQAPGTSHCDDCNCCIEELDHHCPWMGKCIGRRNMVWFKLFNLSWILYLLYFISIAIAMSYR